MKQILAQRDSLPILVFDEIDVGISGAIAQRVGERMSALAGRHQLITITHLPQIAACADYHHLVEKQVVEGAEGATEESAEKPASARGRRGAKTGATDSRRPDSVGTEVRGTDEDGRLLAGPGEQTGTGMRTRTNIRTLTIEERAAQVAALISGAEVTDAGLTSARELLKANRN